MTTAANRTASTATKTYYSGTHRVRPPDDTLADFGRHCDTMGITRLANITGLDWVGIPVYTAIRPNSRSLSVSQGKGVTHDAAKASALMESIEYWHAEYVDLPLRHESYRQLADEGHVVDVHRLPLRGGLDGIDANSPSTPAAATFDCDRPTLWLTGRDLLNARTTWLPFETVRLNKVGLDYAATTFRVSSNGLASGNTRDEAILHGLCELIERDALTLWWQGFANRSTARRTKVALDSITDPGCQELLARFDAAGIAVVVWDVTSNIGVPTFAACIVEETNRPAWRPFGACWGYGAHPAPDVALSRALTEAAQSRVTVIAGSRDENFAAKYAKQHDRRMVDTARRVLFAEPGRLDFTARKGLSGPTLDGDLAAVSDRLRAVGVDEILVVDLTKPALGIPVVKVLVPGLEFYSLFPGYTPGARAKEHAEGTGV